MESLETISLMTMQRAPIIAVLCVWRDRRLGKHLLIVATPLISFGTPKLHIHWVLGERHSEFYNPPPSLLKLLVFLCFWLMRLLVMRRMPLHHLCHREQFNQRSQSCPKDKIIHHGQEFVTSHLLTLCTVFSIRKAQLGHICCRLVGILFR